MLPKEAFLGIIGGLIFLFVIFAVTFSDPDLKNKRDWDNIIYNSSIVKSCINGDVVYYNAKEKAYFATGRYSYSKGWFGDGVTPENYCQ